MNTNGSYAIGDEYHDPYGFKGNEQAQKEAGHDPKKTPEHVDAFAPTESPPPMTE